ncbi:hypothetical protein ACFWPU_10420 [Streptomyces sp. NPDC058471]|uniref:hypothetical protein n=1 Tax=Streptomyces sp. NPDC058471 TaxID=3346516 RepID=UPI003668E9E1
MTQLDRRHFILHSGAITLGAAGGAVAVTDPAAQAATPARGGLHGPNAAPLAPTAFQKLPVGSVTARGWLRGYVDLAALTGDRTALADSRRWIDAIIATQEADGFSGPRKLRTQLNGGPDFWP